jgi:hypothetical protein
MLQLCLTKLKKSGHKFADLSDVKQSLILRITSQIIQTHMFYSVILSKTYLETKNCRIILWSNCGTQTATTLQYYVTHKINNERICGHFKMCC